MKKTLVILSGGQDSTTCLYWAKKQPQVEQVHALTFDYGQRHGVEIDRACGIARRAGVDSHEVLQLPAKILQGTSPLTNPSQEVERYASADVLPGGLEKTFVPGRNILFLTLAANRAHVLGCDALVIGVSQEDFGGYPDCRASFIEAMGIAISEGMPSPIEIKTPLIDLDKKQTVWMAKDLGPECWEALGYSHTCYNGESPPCGSCHACLLRQKGFDEAGLTDPLIERLGGRS